MRLAAAVPSARIVKAFNTLGAELLETPSRHGRGLEVHLCGDDDGAKALVAAFAESLGLAPLDCGPLRNARLTEHLAALWVHLATVGGHGRAIAFELLRVPELPRG